MGKFKFIESAYNKDNGQSIVKIKYKDKYYYGTAQTAIEDIGMSSSFLGCHIAELRAIKNAMIAEKKEKIREMKTLEKFSYLCPRDIGDMVKRLQKDIDYRDSRIAAIDNAIKGKIDSFYNFLERKNNE